MTTQQILLGLGGGLPLIQADAADFDGTNDYALRGAGLTNAADSKLMTFVMWQKADVVSTSYYVDTTDARFTVQKLDTSRFSVNGQNSVGTGILTMTSLANVSTTAWQCWMCSVDMTSTLKRWIYLGDTDNFFSAATYTDDVIDFTVIDWATGATTIGTSKFDGGLAEVMLWTGVYTDFSVQANRRLFFSVTGKPVDPNTPGGAIATLGAPDIYFHLNDGEVANNFVANNDGGDGGAFTVTGALSTYATSPSD